MWSATARPDPPEDLQLHGGRERAKVLLRQQPQHLDGKRKRLMIAVQARKALLGGDTGDALLGV
jgi:hypothetical protein